MTFPMSHYPPGCSGPPEESDYDVCRACDEELDGPGSLCRECEEADADYQREIMAEQRAEWMRGW